MRVNYFDEVRGIGREVIRKDDNGTTASDVFRRYVSESEDPAIEGCLTENLGGGNTKDCLCVSPFPRQFGSRGSKLPLNGKFTKINYIGEHAIHRCHNPRRRLDCHGRTVRGCEDRDYFV